MLKVNDKAPAVSGISYSGPFATYDEGYRHIAFHRYAACPVCTLSMREFTTRANDLKKAQVQHIAVFHSPLEKMKKYYPEQPPFDIILDPGMSLYNKYDVTGSLLGYLSPQSGLELLKSFSNGVSLGLDGDGEKTTMPADFLINPDGLIVALNYGKFVGDSWKVDDVLSIKKQVSR